MNFQGLLYEKNGNITGAMAPVMAAQIFCREHKFVLSGLARVNLPDEVHNWYEGPGRRECLTGCDTLLILSAY